MENIGHNKTTEFINQLELLSIKADKERMIESVGGKYCEKDYLVHLVKEARELLKYNEWLIALENTLDNLCEVDYKLEGEILDLASDAMKVAANLSDRAGLIELLKK